MLYRLQPAVRSRRRSGLVALVLFAVLASPSAALATGRALLIGVSDYPRLRQELGHERYEKEVRLRGPANDVVLMRDLLVDVFGFEASNIEILSGWGKRRAGRPTRRNISAAFGRLAASAKSGDQVVVYLAGHGSQQPDRLQGPAPSPEEPDWLDEIFLAADASGWKSKALTVENAIVDEDLGKWLTAVRRRGANVLVVIDACHSGTGIRAGGSPSDRPRYLNPDLLGVPLPAGRTTVAESPDFKSGSSAAGTLAALYAAQPDERTVELPFPPGAAESNTNVHGLFTHTLVRVVRETRPATYRELLRWIHVRYRAMERRVPSPFGEGDLDREVLGTTRLVQAPIRLQRLGDTLEVSGGALAGLSEGAILAVRRGDKSFGYVRIATVGATTASVEPVAFGGMPAPTKEHLPLQGDCEIVREDLHLPAIRLRTPPSPGSEGNEDAGGIRAAVVQLAKGDVSIASADDASAWSLEAETGGVILRSPGAPWGDGAVVARLPSGDTVAEQIVAVLRRIRRWEGLLRIAARLSGVVADDRVRMETALLHCSGCKGEPAGSCGAGCEPIGCKTLADGAQLEAGTVAAVQVRNTGKRDLDVTLLALGSDRTVASLFPDPVTNEYPRVRVGDTLRLPLCVDASSLGEEHLVSIAVRGAAEPADFTWLADRSGTRGTNARPEVGRLQQLLSHLRRPGETRGVSDAEERRGAALIQLLSWKTVEAKRADLSTP